MGVPKGSKSYESNLWGGAKLPKVTFGKGPKVKLHGRKVKKVEDKQQNYFRFLPKVAESYFWTPPKVAKSNFSLPEK